MRVKQIIKLQLVSESGDGVCVCVGGGGLRMVSGEYCKGVRVMCEG